MQRLILLCFVIFISCEDKQSQPKQESTATPVESNQVVESPEEKKDTIVVNTPEFPILTEKTAMEFFLQYQKENHENKVRLYTDFGEIDILLYPKTKFHRANFIYLTKRGYFDNTQFYRVVKNFIIQGGNTDDAKVKRKRKKIGKYLLPTDTKRGYTHSRGAVSMPSSEIANPHKLASPYEFFIIQDPKGQPRLDEDYTVFGTVIRGMEVVDKIAAVETDKAEWPLRNVYIRKAEIIE